MYNKIRELHNKIGTVQFAMAVSHLLQKGVDIMKEVSDKDIKLSGDNFAQTVNTDTRELARIIDDDPICVVLYCMSKEIFDVNSLLPFEEQIISKVVWKNKDVISIYKEVTDVTPTEEQLQEVLDNICYSNLDSCSYMRYLATLGFNTKQWWVYDNKKDVFIDPPIEVLEQLESLSNDDAQRKLEEIANSKPSPDWLFDKDYWYDGDI